jgi:hypothetical protein
MTKKAPTCRPSGGVYELSVTDEAGRMVLYRVQIDSRGVACWTDTSDGGRLSPNELFSACLMKRSGVE